MSGIPAGAGALLGKRLGKFEILALLALGGTAEIYLARIGGAAGFEKYVVVKCLHDHLADDTEFVKMFLDEARLAAHLDHSNIVQTMELGEHENRYYMVMEFLAGLSLAMIVRRAGERLPNGRLPVPMALNMLAQACAGLHYAHEKAMNGKALNIVHRDISPQNLVISFEGVVKVVDFGIAKAELRETKTRSGTIKGKFAYMSPEQCIANNVDRRTDVFALGVIAHELLTGKRLFKKPSPYETYQAVIECAVDVPSKLNHELDPALDPVIMRAVAKDKEARYPSAEAFGDALLGYLHHRGKGSGPGDVSRFFDTTFAQEIEEHGARMRELISGRDAVAEQMKWDEEEEDKRRNETVDLSGKGTETGIDAVHPAHDRPSSTGMSGVMREDDLGEGRDEDDDDMPAERTRIENNPLEQVQALDQEVAKGKTPPPQLTNRAASVRTPPVGSRAKTPAPALVPTQIADLDATQPKPRMPPSGPLPLPAPPSGPLPAASSSTTLPKVSSGKFPDLANLPTMIADADEESKPGDDTASTSVATPILDRQKPQVDPLARTGMDMQAPNLNGVRVSDAMPAAGRPQSVPPLPQQPTQMAAAHPGPGPGPGIGPVTAAQMLHPMPGPQPPPPQLPQNFSYPVMNTELRDQIATGASVFPSPPQRSSMPSGPPPLGHDSGPHDPQRLAEMASPVGQHYPEQVDWAAAAAAPAKALPPWKLVVLFVATIGIALTLTILIAKIIS